MVEVVVEENPKWPSVMQVREGIIQAALEEESAGMEAVDEDLEQADLRKEVVIQDPDNVNTPGAGVGGGTSGESFQSLNII